MSKQNKNLQLPTTFNEVDFKHRFANAIRSAGDLSTVSRRLGLSKSSVSRYTSEAQLPSLTMFASICREYCWSPAYLFWGVGELSLHQTQCG